MLSIFDASATLGRRELLRIGSLALGGFSLADLLAGRAQAAATSARPVHDKSVVLLFMQGGPSQFETFDPKKEYDIYSFRTDDRPNPPPRWLVRK